MSRYTRIIDGCNVTDIALAESGYDYYLYVRPDGSGIIMRANIAETEFRFSFFGYGDVDTIWADRENRNYIRPSQLK